MALFRWAALLVLCGCASPITEPFVPVMAFDAGALPPRGLGDPDASVAPMPDGTAMPLPGPGSVIPPPPPTGSSCPSGSIDLGAMTSPGATSVVPLGTLLANEPVTAFGASESATSVVSLCAPDDTVSLLVSWERDGWLAGLLSPFEGELIDARSIDTYRSSPAGFGDGAVLLPIVPSEHVAGGTFQVRFGGVGPTVSPSIAIRRGEAGHTLHLNLIYIDSSLTTADYAQFDVGFATFIEYFASIGVTVGDIAVATIRDRALEITDSNDLESSAARIRAPVTVYGDRPLRDDAIAIYVVREIDSTGYAGGTLGGFSPLTGPVPGGRAGIVISSVGLRSADRSIYPTALYYTLSHELGHYLGLRHTSESDGTIHDLLVDTGECGAESDYDRDGVVRPDECAGRGGDNLMFWNGHEGAFEVSADQARVLTMNPLLRGS